jgi:hypothetical protein
VLDVTPTKRKPEGVSLSFLEIVLQFPHLLSSHAADFNIAFRAL